MKHWLLAVLLSAIVVGCSGNNSVPAALPGDVGPVSADAYIVVDDSFFEPVELVVTEGTAVTWLWQGRVVHDVAGPGFTSPVQVSDEFSHTFDQAGTYAYRCTLHSGMNGTVFVVPST